MTVLPLRFMIELLKPGKRLLDVVRELPLGPAVR